MGKYINGTEAYKHVVGGKLRTDFKKSSQRNSRKKVNQEDWGGKQREGCCKLVRENPIRQTKPTQGEPVECSMEPRARRGKGVAPRCSDYPSALHEVAAEQAKAGKQREGCCELVRENPIRQTKPTQGEPVGCSMEPRARRGKGVAPR